MRIAIYCRKSTDDKKNQKASLEDQKKWALDYMKQFKGATLVKVFEEKKSAKDPGRPMFGELMKLVYDGELDMVLSWSMDRLSRNDIDEGALKWVLREGRRLKEIHTKDSVYDENNIFTMGIFLSLGAEEIATLKKRIMRRMENMVTLEGKVPFHAPLGYKNIGEGVVAVHPEESKIVKRIFQLRKDGNSLQQIADILNDDHVPTRQRDYPGSKKIWTKRLIEKVIKNQFYLGIVKYAKFVGEGLYDRFISDELFEEVNSEKRMNIGYRHLDFLLKGLVVDHEGTKLTASKVKGKYVYYHNNGWKTKISEKELFEKVGEVINLWKLPDDMVEFLEEKIRTDLFQEADALLEEKKSIEKQLEELSRTEYGLTTLCGKGKISEEMLERQTIEIISNRKRLSKELEGFCHMNFASIEKFQKTIELVRNLYGFYKTADAVTKGSMIREGIIELKIEVDGSITIHEKEPFYWLSILNVPFGASNGTRTHNGRHGKAVL